MNGRDTIMQENEKSKKKTIEKLHMILDNPYSEELHIENEKNLDALRERLVKPNNGNFNYIHETFGSEDDSLNASVTIHKKEKDNLAVPEFKQVEPEVEKQKEDPFKDEELYEVEKVETYLPEFVEVKPEESVKEEKTPAEEKPESMEREKVDVVKSPESVNEKLPEWEPVDDGETKAEEVKEEREEEVSEWEPISGEEPEWKKKKLPVAEKIKEGISVADEESKIDVFKDIGSIDEKTAKLLYKNRIISVDILRETPINELTKIKGIRRKLAKKIKREVDETPKRIDEKDEWHVVVDAPKSNIKEKKKVKPSFHKDEVPEQKQQESKTYRYGDYALYRKEIKVGPGKKRTIHFFSRTEPEDGGPVNLPEGYEVKVNKKTGVPYIRKKK
jgi:hypothetical protein